MANPFPALSIQSANSMWGRGIAADQDRDTWEQLVWFISQHSITIRKKQLENQEQPTTSLDSAALPILKRAEKLHQLENKPNSLTTAMPRRIVSTWDLNESKNLSKHATALATLDILHQSNDKLLQDIHHLSTKRRMREETGSALSQRCRLSDIHHLSAKRRI